MIHSIVGSIDKVCGKQNEFQKRGEQQYQESIEEYKHREPEKLGLMSSWSFNNDPKRLAFVLSRYKFVSKMLEGATSVLEVGCGDGFGSRIVAQSVKKLTAVDFDKDLIESAKLTMSREWPFTIVEHDVLESPTRKLRWYLLFRCYGTHTSRTRKCFYQQYNFSARPAWHIHSGDAFT